MKLAYSPAIAGVAILIYSTPAIAAPTPTPPLTMEAKLVPADQTKLDRPQGDLGDIAVECIVKNISRQPVSIVSDNYDYDNWETDHQTLCQVPGPTAGAHPAILARMLAPGKTYTRVVPIHFMKMKRGEKVTFKMVFSTNPYHFTNSNGNYAPKAYTTPGIVIMSNTITATVPSSTSTSAEAFGPSVAGSYITPISRWRKPQSWSILNDTSKT